MFPKIKGNLLIFSDSNSLLHMKITASVTKSLDQDHGQCYLHLLFFSYTYPLILLENKKVVVIAVFLSKLDRRPLFNDIYHDTNVVSGLVSI